MLKLRKIAITGGICSGKSTVCRILEKEGAFQVNADAVVHHLLSDHPTCRRKAIELFGQQIVTHHHIDRKKVADIVFADPLKLQALEELLHPFILEAINARYRDAQEKGYKLFVVEVPLLYEVGWEKDFDVIAVVASDEGDALSRFLAKGGSKEDYARRKERQLDQQEKVKRADFIIINQGNLEKLELNVQKFIEFLNQHF